LIIEQQNLVTQENDTKFIDRKDLKDSQN